MAMVSAACAGAHRRRRARVAGRHPGLQGRGRGACRARGSSTASGRMDGSLRSRRRRHRAVGDDEGLAARDDDRSGRGARDALRLRIRARRCRRTMFSTRSPAGYSLARRGGLNDADAGPGFAGGEGLRRGAGLLRRQARLHAHRRQLRARAEQALGGDRATRRGAGRAPNYCWRAARIRSRSRASATRPAAACSCSSTPTISGATSTRTRRSASSSCASPSEAPYGTVAVFKDLYGTMWDLVQLRA